MQQLCNSLIGYYPNSIHVAAVCRNAKVTTLQISSSGGRCARVERGGSLKWEPARRKNGLRLVPRVPMVVQLIPHAFRPQQPTPMITLLARGSHWLFTRAFTFLRKTSEREGDYLRVHKNGSGNEAPGLRMTSTREWICIQSHRTLLADIKALELEPYKGCLFLWNMLTFDGDVSVETDEIPLWCVIPFFCLTVTFLRARWNTEVQRKHRNTKRSSVNVLEVLLGKR